MAFEGVKETGQVLSSVKEIGSLFRQGADDARMFALTQVERIIINLDSIRDAIDALDSRDEKVIANASLDANTTETVIDARRGFQHTIENISIIADGATDVDVFVGSVGDSGFRARYSFSVADSDHDNGANIFAPSGSPIQIRTSAAAIRVNMQAKRDKIEKG